MKQWIAFYQQHLLVLQGSFLLPSGALPKPDFCLALQPQASIELAVFSQLPELPGLQLWTDKEVRTLSTEDLMLYGRARTLYAWYQQHRFCGYCGHPTEPMIRGAEIYAHCPNCQARHYPRVNPCIITVVTRGEDLLLAQGKRHRTGLYAAIAGFVDAGESAEQALVREVQEEVGLEVYDQQYLGSESWPFPQQLMLAYQCQCLPGELRLQASEILDARWFHYQNLPDIPPVQTIAGRMIRYIAKTMQEAKTMQVAPKTH